MLIATLCDLKPRQPHLSLAIDEAISQYYGRSEFGRSQDFSAAIRLWQNPPAICLGRTCKATENLPPEFLNDSKKTTGSFNKSRYLNNITVLRRASGGGTVLHGPGNWNYSLFFSQEKFPELFPVQKSYELILGLVSAALSKQNIESRYVGQSDLAIPHDGQMRKISGNSQFRKNKIIVHHGTLLCSSEFVSSIAKMLPHPPKEPDYRRNRSHKEFMASLPAAFNIQDFFKDLSEQVQMMIKAETIQRIEAADRKNIFQLAYRLAKKVYTNRDWILSGTHPF